MNGLTCANCGRALPTPRRLKTFCSYACRGQSEAQKATADRSGLVCSKNTKQNKALQSLRRQSVGAVTFAKINPVTIRVDRPRKKGAGWLMEAAWPGMVRQRWVAESAIAEPSRWRSMARSRRQSGSYSKCGNVESRSEPDEIAALNKIAANEVDRVALQKERRRWPIDLMNGTRRGFVEHRHAIIETELGLPSEDCPSFLGDDYPLDFDADGYAELPECLRRTAEPERLSDAA